MSPGKFIVLEGSDGSGKTVQFNLLLERLQKEGLQVAKFDFPRYGEPSAYFVENYLRGEYGSLEEIGPQRASLFFALDRFAAAQQIRVALKEGKLVLSNRYVGSNMGHQGAKMDHPEERRNYFQWLDNLEFTILGIPRPDLNLILHVPAEIAHGLVGQKEQRGYLKGRQRDLHEADLDYLRKTEAVYLEIARLFPQNFTLLECMEDGKLMSIEAVHKRVWDLVKNAI